MMKCVAIDDEPLALEIIETFGKQTQLFESISFFTNTDLAFQFIVDNKIDLVFLDINMPAISGIDFYKSLPYKPLLILTTSYTEFALESYELKAIDYLLKPYSYKRFEDAAQYANKQYNLLQQESANKEKQFIIFKTESGVTKVFTEDILYIKALDNYLKINVQGMSSFLVRMTMKSIDNLLDSNKFVRVHKSFIVSLNKIDCIKGKFIFIQKEEIPIGKNFEENFKNQYHF
ncbi:MAG: DNA-binding response regulator [Pseudopedobacter saltans]|uniref:DNA-binding response regulator n=1 Tax=Pseudopedobacter saltans TaxID=151895 RepID=A0A2W5EYM9_9SPHI|nr:MAG: DNA-binding response regulator [Pseudopedobacter saltans]